MPQQIEELAGALNTALDRLSSTAAEGQQLQTELTCSQAQLDEATAELQQLR